MLQARKRGNSPGNAPRHSGGQVQSFLILRGPIKLRFVCSIPGTHAVASASLALLSTCPVQQSLDWYREERQRLERSLRLVKTIVSMDTVVILDDNLPGNCNKALRPPSRMAVDLCSQTVFEPLISMVIPVLEPAH
jgi:hypothetical protein